MSSSEIDWAIVTLKFIVGYFLVYFATITIFIIIPATLNISLNVKERYVSALLKIFEVGILRIFVLLAGPKSISNGFGRCIQGCKGTGCDGG